MTAAAGTTSITLIRDRRGDFQMHLTGCSDIRRSHDYAYESTGPAVYAGESLLDAIVVADTDMASWFCRQPYDGRDEEIGEHCWSTEGVDWAPCFADAVKAAGIKVGRGVRPTIEKKGEPDMTSTATATKPMTRSEAIRSGRKPVKAGIEAILAGTTTADAVLAEVAAVVPEATPEARAETLGTLNAAAKAHDWEAATVIVNGAPEPKARKARKAVKDDAGVVIATVAPEPKADPLAGRVLISMEERDRILAGSDKALIARVEAGTYVRPNGKAPGRTSGLSIGSGKGYARWRLAVSLTDKQAERVTTVPVEPSWSWANPDGRKPREAARKAHEVRESAKGAPALPAPEKVARVRKAKAVIEATETLAGSEYIAAVGADDAQEALAVLAGASVGAAHSDDLPF
ncbi:MAG: hypothetical protein MUE82_08040 [Chloroflexi bacterium]|jgi:hypothetical protein|nr:hypothetical protein [Chloroflexota bacterium]